MTKHLLNILTKSSISKPDWDYWGKKREICLWQAVCLSFDRSPHFGLLDGFFYYPSGMDNPDDKFWVLKGFTEVEMDARFEIAQSHIDIKDCFTIISRSEKASAGDYTVDLPSFGSWAIRIGIQIPNEFPREQCATLPEIAQDRFTGAWISKGLETLIKIAYECYSGPANPEKQDYVARRISQELNYEIHHENGPGAVARSLAALIRPDDFKQYDKRATKKKRVTK